MNLSRKILKPIHYQNEIFLAIPWRRNSLLLLDTKTNNRSTHILYTGRHVFSGIRETAGFPRQQKSSHSFSSPYLTTCFKKDTQKLNKLEIEATFHTSFQDANALLALSEVAS